jgi:hypothetical protein
MGRSIGSPEISPTTTPISQNGIERARTNKKKIKGDLFVDVLASMTSSSPFLCKHIKPQTAEA